ncbi:hypothetical protein E4U15_002103 [Claviceps sp. LM218 group G6]|nr:hypothetical protein E4U15_002103 [Claviceps sp. LM218 group G6]
MERNWAFGDKGKGMRNESHLDAGYQRKRKAVERTPEEYKRRSAMVQDLKAVELAAFITGVPIPAAMMPVVLIFNPPPPKTVGTDGVWVKGQLLNGLIRKGSPEHWYFLATGLSRSAYATSGSVPRRAAYVVDTFPFEPLAFSLRQDTSTQ